MCLMGMHKQHKINTKIRKLTKSEIVEGLIYFELNNSCQERNSNLRKLSLIGMTKKAENPRGRLRNNKLQEGLIK